MQVYYINLDRRTDRRAFMEAQFSRLGLLAHRISAMRLDEIKSTDRVAGYPWLEDGGIVCGLSHIRALTVFLETGAPWALILEDDAALSDSVPEVLRLAAEGAIAADMVRFEGCGPILSGPLTPIGSGFSLCKNYSWSAGSAAYLASRHAAEVLVRGRWLRNQYADVALFDPYQPLARTLDVQQLNPALVVQQRWLEQQSGIGTTDLPSRPTPDRSFREVVRKVGTSLNRDVYGAALKAWQRRFRGAAIRDVGFKPD